MAQGDVINNVIIVYITIDKMEKKKTTHGGKRKNAGRKPIKDKKVPVILYFKKSKIKEIGLAELKQQCYELFDVYE